MSVSSFTVFFFLLKTFIRIKMTCVNKKIEVLRGKKKEEDPNHLPNFDLVRFLPTWNYWKPKRKS